MDVEGFFGTLYLSNRLHAVTPQNTVVFTDWDANFRYRTVTSGAKKRVIAAVVKFPKATLFCGFIFLDLYFMTLLVYQIIQGVSEILAQT
jgi:hypothetical protein